MTDAPREIYTNANATMLVTPPAIPLHETDVAWHRADQSAALVKAALKDAFDATNSRYVGNMLNDPEAVAAIITSVLGEKK